MLSKIGGLESIFFGKKKKGITVIQQQTFIALELCDIDLLSWLKKSARSNVNFDTIMNIAIGAAFSVMLLENKGIIHC